MCYKVDSLEVMRRYGITWRLLGMRMKNRSWLQIMRDVLITITVTIWYPLHFTIALFISLHDTGEICLNLVMNIASIMCSVKQFLYRQNFQRMDDINKLTKQLDKRVRSQAEVDYHRKFVRAPTNLVLNLFIFFYNGVGISSFLMMLMKPQPALIYPAWFPFDWQASSLGHIAAVAYQVWGLMGQITQNIANDAYVPIQLCTLAGHTKLLGMRIASIGHDKSKTELQHYNELMDAVRDHRILKRIFLQLQTTISWSILLQSITNGVDFCIGLIYLIFYAADLFQTIYAIGMLGAICIQYYPVCYYGSVVEQNFHDLTYAIFSCKWHERSFVFRCSLKIFAEISLREITPYAKGFIKINLDTYIGIMKASYSLFCILVKSK